MPGDRLDDADRRAIAEGLAAGLGYAEIAARLGRPTSTVSREVARNGGHNHYRAADARQQAARRAVRRRPVAPETRSGGGDETGTEAGAGAEARLVAMMSDAGMPRMLARVLVALFLSPAGTRTAAELAGGLRVSRASVSKAVGQLEQLGFVRREREPGRRTERYVLDQDMWSGVWTARTEVMAGWGATTHEIAAAAGLATPVGTRLEELSRFLLFLHGEMARAAARWPAVRDGRDRAAGISGGGAART